MEKHSTQKSTVSPASRASKQTPETELHYRLSIDNSSDATNKTMPGTPQRNLVHTPQHLATSDRLGVTMHPAQPDWTFDEIVKV